MICWPMRACAGPLSARELAQRFERVGLPYAPITRPQDLFEDPHLLATGGLAPVTLPADASGAGRVIETRTALLPLTINGARLAVREAPPALGADTLSLLQALGYDERAVAELVADQVVGVAGDTAAPL